MKLYQCVVALDLNGLVSKLTFLIHETMIV